MGLIGEATAAFVVAHAAELDALVDPSVDRRFDYFGLRTVHDRYLLRHPYTRLVLETPQHWLLRVACGLARDVAEAGELYRLMSSLAYLPSSPTLFNSGTAHAQMSSCYLLDSPRDDLDSIYQQSGVDWGRLRATVHTAVRFLDRVIDINYYPTPQAAASNPRWRPVGLDVMGLQDVFFTLGLPFDAPEARQLSTRIAEEIALTALETSVELAREHGPHPAFGQTRAARGVLHLDHFGVVPAQPGRWAALRAAVAEHGLRNALLIAIAPTATIASIAGCYECIEPQVSTVFKRETLSGEFLQLNSHLWPS